MHPAYQFMIGAWIFCLGWIAFVIFTQRKIHPKALFYLFFVELWERFSYYGMRALLVLYMTSELLDGGFGYEDSRAYGVYAAYGALVYSTPLIGGYLAEKVMGYRKAIMWGAILMALGHFAMAFEHYIIFYAALALLILGNGFFKPNISSMIGKFYGEGDPRRDGAFTIFYMGINIGAFLTPLTCGTIGELEGWHYGFSLAGIGMLIGLIIFWFAQKNGALEDKGYQSEEAIKLNENKKIAGMKPLNLIYLGSFLVLPIVWGLVYYNYIVEVLLPIIIVAALGYILYISSKMERIAKQRMWVIVTLFFFTAVFWSFFELAGSALTLFTDRNVDKTVFGMELTTTFFIAVNPLFIMLFAPIFSWMWIKMNKSGVEPAAPVKFAGGLILLGLGFLVLNLGSAGAVAGAIGGIFIVLLYLLHTLGELTLSPVGLSLVTKLSPAKMVGFIMGFWLMSSAVAHQVGAPIARLTSINEAELLESEGFKNCMTDANLKSCMAAPTFIKCLETGSVDGCIATTDFLTDFKNRTGEQYYVAKAKIAGSTNKIKTFVTKDVSFKGSSDLEINQLKELSNQDVVTLSAGSPAKVIGACLSQQSLGKCLSVFTKLGFFAVGCGVLLLLLAPIITRWMHGIK